MGAGIIALIVVIVLVAAGALWVIGSYNSLVRAREMVKNAMGQIAAQIESRWDAITNLIAAAKEYAAYEADTLSKVTAQRMSLNAGSSVAQVEADNASFASVLQRLLAVAENYPQLKASDPYVTAMENVNEFENNVRVSRMMFNDVTTKYNKIVLQFPSNIVASIFHFSEKPYFQNDAAKAQMPSW